MENEKTISGTGGKTIQNGAGYTLGIRGTSITTTGTFTPIPQKHVVDTKFIENEEGNFIEVTYKVTYAYSMWIGNMPPQPNCLKERYGIKDGKLQLIKSVFGTYVPEHIVAESFEWDE